jgi:hypothetical protein
VNVDVPEWVGELYARSGVENPLLAGSVALGLFQRMVEHDEPTARHMLRVSITAAHISRALSGCQAFLRYVQGCDEGLLSLAAALHDVGKLVWDRTMFVTSVFTPEQRKRIPVHLQHGCLLLKQAGLHEAAWVMRTHHNYGLARSGYLADFRFGRRSPRTFTGTERSGFRRMGVLLMLADWYDAAFYRKNREGDVGSLLERMQRFFPGHAKMLGYLFQEGVLNERS